MEWLCHAGDQLRDGKARLHVTAHGIQQEEDAVPLVALLQLGQQGQHMLVLGGLGTAGGGVVALDLADNGDAVYRSARCSCRNRAGFRDGILFRCGNGRGFFGHR